ncbi:response regulator transcription factor [Terrihabitans sp. B22-R8]|uniref:response regulator transcription factor n=1 Tax=Terrihabitans sp. B22-R8 TaxID=3425128 RepID=UPI00403C9AC3
MRIFCVEDDPRISADIVACLETNGYVVETCADGEDAWFLGDTEDYAAIILDLGLPGMDGLSILRRWRENGRTFPVIILTARGSWRERVEGIDAGADDYLPKPFEMEELLARLRANLRRTGGHASAIFTLGELTLDTRQMRLTRNGRPIALSPQEYRLIAYLMHNPGRVVSQHELAEHLQGELGDRESNAVEVLVGRVRRKLGADSIETRRGFGYVMGG